MSLPIFLSAIYYIIAPNDNSTDDPVIAQLYTVDDQAFYLDQHGRILDPDLFNIWAEHASPKLAQQAIETYLFFDHPYHHLHDPHINIPF